jgi:pimeloyl-ACP methyl ester carboxylesterase
VTSKTTYVLVHGAGLGGWCWSRVHPLMESATTQVFTPTLTGLGERAHLVDPVPSLDTHIEDVMRVIEAEELERVVPVGHSYAGMVITGVADRIKSRIRRLVYLDAAVPGDGDDFASHIPGISAADVERRRSAFRSMATDGAWLPPLPPEMAGISEAQDIVWVSRRATPHPLRTWLDPVRFRNNGHRGIAKTYIPATRPPTTIMGYPLHGEAAWRGGEWTYREIACGHE